MGIPEAGWLVLPFTLAFQALPSVGSGLGNILKGFGNILKTGFSCWFKSRLERGAAELGVDVLGQGLSEAQQPHSSW